MVLARLKLPVASSTTKPLEENQADPFQSFKIGEEKVALPSSHSSPTPLPAEPEGAELGADPEVVYAAGPIFVSVLSESLKYSPGSAALVLMAAWPSRSVAGVGRLDAIADLNNWIFVVEILAGCKSSGR